MEESGQKPQFAWEPFTPSGIGRFARAPTANVLMVQFLVALATAGVVAWCVHSAWFPVISSAIARLPDEGEIRNGRLDWRGGSPQILAENHFLAVAVDLPHKSEARSPAQLQLELGKSDARLYGVFGFVRLDYLPGWRVACNRVELTPWWGAWAPPLLALLMMTVVLGLMLSWSVLACVYLLPVWLISFFTDRNLTLHGSWRLGAAGLMPAALFMTGTVVLYRLQILGSIGLTIAAVAHFPVGWCCILAAVLSVERHPAAIAAPGNPFKEPSARPPSANPNPENLRSDPTSPPPAKTGSE
jgi:hypothetical protein